MAEEKKRRGPGRPKGAKGKPRQQKDGELYPPGTPTDDNGLFDASKRVDPQTLAHIPLDEESARTSKMAMDVVKSRARGESGTRMPADDRAKYWTAQKLHPHARVSFEREYPERGHNIPAQPLSILKTYDEMIDYVRKYWRGEEARFRWKIGDAHVVLLAQGVVSFAADADYEDEMAKKDPPAPPAPQYPPYPYGSMPVPPGWPPQYPPPPPGYGGYPPPGYPPPGYGYPPPGYPPQAAPPQPAPAPAAAPQAPPAPYPAPPMPQYPPHMDPFMQAMLQQNQQLFTELMQSRQQQPQAPQYAYPPQPYQDPMAIHLAWQAHNAAEEAKKAAAAAEEAKKNPVVAPKTELQAAEDSLHTLGKAVKLARSMADQLDPTRADKEESAAAAKKDDDDFPLSVKDIGPARWAFDKKSGLPVDAVTAAMMNADKIGDGLERVLDKFVGAWKNRGQLSDEEKKAAADAARQAADEFARKEKIAQAGLALEREKLEIEKLRLLGPQMPTYVAPPPAPPPPPVQAAPPPAPPPPVQAAPPPPAPAQEVAPPPAPPPLAPAPTPEPEPVVVRAAVAGGARRPVLRAEA